MKKLFYQKVNLEIRKKRIRKKEIKSKNNKVFLEKEVNILIIEKDITEKNYNNLDVIISKSEDDF